MNTDRLVIIGAGGHAKVVVSSVKILDAAPARIVIADDDAALAGHLLNGLAVQTPIGDTLHNGSRFHVAIGDNDKRAHWFKVALSAGCTPFCVRDPRACITPHLDADEGRYFAAGSIIAADAHVGVGVIVNHGAVVDHDCELGEFSHIAPNATLGGGCRIGARVLVGAGATVLPLVTVGHDAVIGAGSVVISDVEPGITIAGVPARSI